MNSRLVLYALGLVLLAVGIALPFLGDDRPVTEAQPTRTPTAVQAWACPSGQPIRVTCGYVEVPIDHADADGEFAEIYVASLVPVGEPSGAPIAVLGQRLGEPVVADLRAWHTVADALDRQIVLIDLRGSGRSTPSLTCREVTAQQWLGFDLLGKGLASARGDRVSAVTACRKRIAETAPVGSFTLDAIVDDVDVVRDAFDIETWNLMAAGDTSIVARLAAEAHPDRVASMVLLGASARTGPRADLDVVRYAEEALSAALGAGGIERLDEIVTPLAERSIVFAVTEGGATRQVSVSAETVHSTLAMASRDDTARAEIPSVVNALGEGQWRRLAILRSQVYPVDRDWSFGTAAAVACAEATSPDPFWAGDDFEQVEMIGLADDPILDPAVCRAWDVAPSERTELGQPSVPVFVVNGMFDPAAPASATADVLTAWPGATALTIDRGEPSLFDPCVSDLVGRFVSDPTDSIDGSC